MRRTKEFRPRSGTSPNKFPNRQLCQARYVARSVISTHPALYLPFARRKYAGIESRVVSPDADIVIEGFQRSGNTFSVFAFELAQEPDRVSVVHHLHAAAQVVAAVRIGLPTVVLIREPRDAILSHMIREPCVTVAQAIAHWIRFYRTVLPHRDQVVVADFSLVTTDFGQVIRQVNKRFGTSFPEFQHTPANVERCFELTEERNRKLHGSVNERYVARPSSERSAMKDGLQAEFDARTVDRLRERAYSIYHELIDRPA
jgi:hypothetical protein